LLPNLVLLFFNSVAKTGTIVGRQRTGVDVGFREIMCALARMVATKAKMIFFAFISLKNKNDL